MLFYPVSVLIYELALIVFSVSSVCLGGQCGLDVDGGPRDDFEPVDVDHRGDHPPSGSASPNPSRTGPSVSLL